MPSNRRRIGFLPSEEVHEIIEKICINNNFSQSKVTGILVEEALKNRGVIKNLNSKNLLNIDNMINNSNNNEVIPLHSDLSNNVNISNTNKKNDSDELKMINDFIEYKFFKKIMNKYNNQS